MRIATRLSMFLAVALASGASVLHAQAPTPAAAPAPAPARAAPLPYGMSLGLDTAKKAVAAAVAEARRHNLYMAFAIVDTGGHLVYFEKMDGAQTGSVEVSIEKARSAVMFRRSTKVFQDTVAQGGIGWRMLGLTGAVPVDGGVPLVEGGKIVGAIGSSGGTNDEDGMCALAGAAALK